MQSVDACNAAYGEAELHHFADVLFKAFVFPPEIPTVGCDFFSCIAYACMQDFLLTGSPLAISIAS